MVVQDMSQVDCTQECTESWSAQKHATHAQKRCTTEAHPRAGRAAQLHVALERLHLALQLLLLRPHKVGHLLQLVRDHIPELLPLRVQLHLKLTAACD